MLIKFDLIKKVKRAGVVAVVRGKDENNSFETAKACIAGKITAIELAFTSPNADITIKRLHDDYKNNQDVIIGAGTVLDAQTARMAIVAGADFIVSPSFNEETAKLCNLYSIPYMPGCFSPTEIQTALSYGADVIKIFPSSIVGKNIIKEIHGPFPNVNIMPTGGISLENMNEWFEVGAFVVGVGGSLVGPGSKEDYQTVTENAKRFHEKYLDIVNKE
ncbi:bifunctional 2-keto-4-hydroxyglutarate aldolase/2-keto-3-deoxy-6-phosphogluconate aldolase [Lactobacillus sp. ESL0785]|uniref:bifunctional 2-keto-4-hydroxyglutarate aldolase/2-keto-3-deoxy-6-phosphogluconate aldolase n=1 Tax=Lactobacillus sp. ESL0785 TaxID=2983232 RepID=UPI0023F77C03|nr:bifunctional 2-keto-4-hydroxyglutarate aldolase/2-keto-3-deoxy-6-phosphogluconate aldolase [Lactobacillus sp. ESL0785]WEV70902.1 bifunctional 2-keto-4-hydroxyglutarate aldolase/2-keto-3-deoxy-6-phosphogluconate aldolase [Lactobacillus sp. ESL0785]